MPNNNLTGNFDFQLDFWTELKIIDLSGNMIDGIITEDIFNIDSIQSIDLSHNQLSGYIPEIVFNSPQLTYLDLSYNQLVGNIILGGDSTTALKYLDISYNKINHIPKLNFILDSLLVNDNSLVFGSIEPNLDQSVYMNYLNQDSIGIVIDTIIKKGFGFSYFVTDFAESNEYVWYHNNVEIDRSSSNLFAVDSLDFADSGEYRFEIVNSVADQLIIHGRSINIQISDLNTTLLIFQNPIFTQKFKALLRSDTPLNATPLVRLNNFILTTINTDSNSQNYSSSFSIGSNGTYTITATSQTDGNLTDVFEKQFTITIVPVDSSSKLISADQSFSLEIPAYSIDEKTTFYIEQQDEKLFRIEPNLSLSKVAKLEVKLPDSFVHSKDIALYYSDGAQESYVENQTRYTDKISATVSKTGTYKLMKNTLSKVTGVTDFKLYRNYPNPFNPTTTIRYDLQMKSHVSLDILNILGQRIKTLVDEEQIAGNGYRYQWDGKNKFSQTVASGIYFYRLKTNNKTEINKMIFIK